MAETLSQSGIAQILLTLLTKNSTPPRIGLLKKKSTPPTTPQNGNKQMNNAVPKDNKTHILEAFRQLLNQRKTTDSKVATKEETAAKEQNKQLLEVATTYTVDGIVKGLADLQLEFGSIVSGISEKLVKETQKLDELKQAIEIETQHLQELQKIRIVADALDIITQEHQAKLKNLDQDATEHQQSLEKQIVEARKKWQKEQEENEATLQQQTELLVKQRQQETENYQYELERRQKIETDDYENRARQQERELQDIEQTYQKQWQEREKTLNDHQTLFAEYQQKLATIPEELKKAEDEARKKAIEEVNRDAKVKADLFEKEWEGNKQGYELKIQSLEATIQRQTEQIADLSSQLQATMKQAQELAMRAFATTANSAEKAK
jgi:DNA repair exonuclease SbcCD ATPase subunit